MYGMLIKNYPFHVDPIMVLGILEHINKNFEDLVISRGDKHDFLGMNKKVSNENKVDIIMKHQIEDTVSQFKDIFDFKATFPCTQHLWDVKDEA